MDADSPQCTGIASRYHQITHRQSTIDERYAALLLQRLPGLGPGTYWKLRNAFKSNAAILNAAPAQLKQHLSAEVLTHLVAWQRNSAGELAEQIHSDLAWCAENHVHVLLQEDEDYPALLKTIDKPPPVLFVQGQLGNLSLPQLAIVGSRNPTTTGRENAFYFAQQLASMGFAITSGMALGIDEAAHRGAMQAAGPTLAVFGTGIDTIYPSRHRALAQQILDSGGTLVSEFPLDTKPQAGHFPRRNRTISGLSLGVLVVEAAVKSGSLITARLALQQGREVFAIPGSIHNPMSRGCHAIIREGGILVEEVKDLREPLQGLLSFKWQESAAARHNKSTEPGNMNQQESALWQALGFEPAHEEMLCQRSGLEMADVLASLLQMELKGWVEQNAAGYQRIAAVVE